MQKAPKLKSWGHFERITTYKLACCKFELCSLEPD